MSNQENNRVVNRAGARDLTAEEMRKVQALGTLTICTAPEPPNPHPDGDAGECGHPY